MAGENRYQSNKIPVLACGYRYRYRTGSTAGACCFKAMEYEADAKQRSLLIPVKNSDQAVEVFADELPDDVNDIIDILRAEVAPLDVWLQFAVR